MGWTRTDSEYVEPPLDLRVYQLIPLEMNIQTETQRIIRFKPLLCRRGKGPSPATTCLLQEISNGGNERDKTTTHQKKAGSVHEVLNSDPT